MAGALEAAGGSAHAPLPRLAATFLTTQLKPKLLATADEAGLQAGCQRLMQQALDQMRAVGGSADAAAAAAGAASSAPGRRAARAQRAAMEGLYALFQSLQTVMASPAYLKVRLFVHLSSNNENTKE